ncbi:hypothetical protein C8Q80DRAFT_336161 [Daedaleopsis nitida]|nr:hypothetical protein C8Q80DRAFT_336161 [Daedaleopsis nitida]
MSNSTLERDGCLKNIFVRGVSPEGIWTRTTGSRSSRSIVEAGLQDFSPAAASLPRSLCAPPEPHEHAPWVSMHSASTFNSCRNDVWPSAFSASSSSPAAAARHITNVLLLVSQPRELNSADAMRMANHGSRMATLERSCIFTIVDGVASAEREDPSFKLQGAHAGTTRMMLGVVAARVQRPSIVSESAHWLPMLEWDTPRTRLRRRRSTPPSLQYRS